jgi:hypothetical protein
MHRPAPRPECDLCGEAHTVSQCAITINWNLLSAPQGLKMFYKRDQKLKDDDTVASDER